MDIHMRVLDYVTLHMRNANPHEGVRARICIRISYNSRIKSDIYWKLLTQIPVNVRTSSYVRLIFARQDLLSLIRYIELIYKQIYLLCLIKANIGLY